MDTSETYIKMRLAAIPDLGMGIPPLEPYHFKKATPSFIETVWIDAKGDWYHSTKDEACQLERQDQLQEMVFQCEGHIDTFYLLAFTQFAHREMDSFTSREQLELAFVMKEKYNKVWNGSEWKIYILNGE